MSKMKDQATFAALSLFAAACGYHSPHFDPDVMCNPTSLHNGVNAYESPKLTGFTQVTGRRRWSKNSANNKIERNDRQRKNHSRD